MGDNNQLNVDRTAQTRRKQIVNTAIAPQPAAITETATSPPATHAPTIDIRGSILAMTPTTTGVT